ncbi:L,D-transpeptidase family protein [soil metagenome]
MNSYKNIIALGLICLITFSCDSFRTPADNFDLDSQRVSQIIASSTDSIQIPEFFPDKDVRKYLYQEFKNFYEQRDFKLAWVNFDEPNPEVEELLEAIDEAAAEGLQPENYKVVEVESLMKNIFKIESKKDRRKRLKEKNSKDEEVANAAKEQDTLRLKNLVKLDFLLTSSYLTYASHLLSGKIHPDEKEIWFPSRRKKELAPYLNEALANRDVKNSLTALAPRHVEYNQLKEAMARYRKIEEEGEWPVLSSIKDLKQGDSNVVIQDLKKRLAMTGDVDSSLINAKDSLIFNEAMVAGLIKYQKRHGLEEIGKLDESCWKMLNVSPEVRIDQIKLNMERMRWMPETFGDRFILVNIPEYQMRFYEDDRVAMEMKVIVGKAYNATPIFSDTMNHIVFSPTWTVPLSIAVEEMLPRIKEDPDYLTKRNLKLYESWEKDAEPIDPHDIKWKKVDEENFNFRIVEDPGEANSLGRVKFMFPNDFDIYLHDTPAGHLFNKRERSFSHGCIRVEKPTELAQYLLKDLKEWDEEKIKEAMNQEEPETVKLPEKIPVHLVYWTAWVDDQGILNFREDIYKQDQEQIKEMENKEKLLLSKNKTNGN